MCMGAVSVLDVMFLKTGSESPFLPAVVSACALHYSEPECVLFVDKLANLGAKSALEFVARPEFVCEELIPMCKTNYFEPIS